MSGVSRNESLEEQFSTKCSLRTSKSENKPLECIPLLLSEVRRCKATSSPAVYEAFNGALFFRTMILHARVVGKIMLGCKNGQYKFEIDDCTSVLPLIFRKKQEDINEVQRLQNEVSARIAGKQGKYILDALQRILDATGKQLDPSRISVGNRIFVFGRPNLFRDQISVFGFSWDLDEGSDRSMELSFKDELIEWYMNKYQHIQPAI